LFGPSKDGILSGKGGCEFLNLKLTIFNTKREREREREKERKKEEGKLRVKHG